MEILKIVLPIAVLAVVLLVIFGSCVKIVPQSRAYVITRLGRFLTVWDEGVKFKVPFVDRSVKNVSLKEQVVDFAPQPVITKDNVTMQIDTVLYFAIVAALFWLGYRPM